jgi:hypothetical protein
MKTPEKLLNAMVLPAPATVPPTLLLFEPPKELTPLVPLPSAAVPVMSVPMKLPII